MSGRCIELLAHAAAPSRASDDTRYRTLGRGYLEFRPTKRTSFLGPASDAGDPVQGIPAPENHTSQHRSPRQESHWASFNLDSPLLSFRSAENNMGSPRLRQRTPVKPQQSQSSWQPPPSEIQDTYPDSNLPLPELCSPTRLLEHYLSTGNSSQLEESPLASRHVEWQRPPLNSSQETTRPFSSLEQPNSQHSENRPVDDSPQPIPDSQHLHSGDAAEISSRGPRCSVERLASPIQEAPKSSGVRLSSNAREGPVIPQSPPTRVKRPFLAEPSSSSGGGVSHISSSNRSQNDNSALIRAKSEPPRKRDRDAQQDPDPGQSLLRSTSDMGPRQKKANTGVTHQQIIPGKPRTTCSGGLEIRSPEPPVGEGILQPDDLIPEPIGSLALKLDLKKRFNPESQSREIRPFERGHWLVDCTTWDDELKWSSWAFLTDYLSNGLAGWGAWCERDPEFSRIRLWCFGHMIGHLHLLLYLVSQRKIIYTGSTWIGAEGTPVVIMGAKLQPT